jgi:hypothetical protein
MIEFLKILKLAHDALDHHSFVAALSMKSIREISFGLLPFKNGLLQQKLWSACGMQSLS